MPKKVRIKEIAKEVGCSPTTVSQAFNNPRLVNRKTRTAILEACQRMGYVRKRFQSKRKKVIGICGISHEMILGDYYNTVTTAILSEAKKQGINVIIECFEDKADSLPHMFSKKILDGVIILGVLSQEHLLLIKQQNLPLVLCGRPISWMELNTVLSDGRAGIYEATKHLIGLGHKKIAYIAGSPIFDPITSDRLDGYRYALAEATLSVPEQYITIGNFSPYEKETDNAIDHLLALKNLPTAIVCESDGIAYQVYHRLKEKGFKIPQDLSITGFDNIPSPPYINKVKPKLTTVDVNLYQLGIATVKVLLDNIENPSPLAYRHTLPVQLVIGETTTKT